MLIKDGGGGGGLKEGERERERENTVESRSNGPASNGNPPKTEASPQKGLFNFYIYNNRNLSIIDIMVGSLKSVKAGVYCTIFQSYLAASIPKN